MDEPSKEKLIGIRPSIKNGSKGMDAFMDVMTPTGPEESLARTAEMMVPEYLMDGMLPVGTIDKDKSMDTREVEFRAIEKG